MPKDYMKPITMTSLDTATLAGDYVAINSSGLEKSCVLIRLINDSNRDLTVSYDGTIPHDYVRAGSTLELNLQANSRPNNKVAQLKAGTVVHVKAAAGTGYVYLVGYYQPMN